MKLIGYPRVMHAAQWIDLALSWPCLTIFKVCIHLLRNFLLGNKNSLEVQAIPGHPKTRKDMIACGSFNRSNR